MMLLVKSTLIIFLTTLLCPLARANILFVPTQFQSIDSAESSASMNDTIILSNGSYTDQITLHTSLTIGSFYILTHDSNSIRQTNWLPTNSIPLIDPDSNSVNLIGLHFISSSQPVTQFCVITGRASGFQLDHCVFSGTFDASLTNVATISLNPISAANFNVTNCIFETTNLSAGRLIAFLGPNGGRVYISNCVFLGRSTGAGHTIYITNTSGSTVVRNCQFRHHGDGIYISSNASYVDGCEFVGLNDQAIVMQGRTDSAIVSNCRFDSISANSGMFGVVEFFSSPGRNIMRNCTVSNVFATNNSYLLWISTSLVRIYNCLMYNNIVLRFISLTNADSGSSFDSCRVRNSSFLYGVYSLSNTPRFHMSWCDFDGVYIDTLTRSIDSIFAPNCWWGDPTGPRYNGNPNGLGMLLSNNINPIPWRLSPVFPTDEVSDRNISDLLPNRISVDPAFPNPFNSSTTLSYTLPINAHIDLRLYDLNGREMQTLVSQRQNAGTYRILLDGSGHASGTYFVRLQAGEFSKTQKIVLLK